MKTETYKVYSRDFWIFLPNIIKIDPYNFELYRFKVGLFLRHSVFLNNMYFIYHSWPTFTVLSTKRISRPNEDHVFPMNSIHQGPNLSTEEWLSLAMADYLFSLTALLLTEVGRLYTSWTHKRYSLRNVASLVDFMFRLDKKAHLAQSNPRDAKSCKNCSNSTCFVSFHRNTFPRISNYRCIASRGKFRL